MTLGLIRSRGSLPRRLTGRLGQLSQSVLVTTTTGSTATPSWIISTTASNTRSGHSLYYVRNSFFFIDATFQFARRATLFTSYRVNHDNGQGSRVADPIGNPGNLLSSYPMTFQSPEARLAIKINRRLDWNFGYQYYNYNESPVVGPRPQNYHAHLPYTSLRLYIGRKE